MSSSSRPQTPTNAPVINHPAHSLLTRAHSPTTATTIFTDKVKNKPLLLHPTSQSTNTTTNKDSRSLRRHVRLRKKQYHLQHQKPRPLSAKEKRQLGVYNIQPFESKYSIYEPLNRLWTGYILEVLGLLEKPVSRTTTTNDNSTNKDATSNRPKISSEALSGTRTISAAGQGSLLASADFHGMNIEVVRSKDVGRVGLKGIIIRETRSTFVVVTPSNRCVTIMKKESVFRVVIVLDDELLGWKVGGGLQGIDGGGGMGGLMVDVRESEGERGDAMRTDDQVEDGEETTNRKDEEQDKDEKLRKEKKRTIVFDLHGSQLEIRPVERAIRKFKWKSMDYL